VSKHLAHGDERKTRVSRTIITHIALIPIVVTRIGNTEISISLTNVTKNQVQ